MMFQRGKPWVRYTLESLLFDEPNIDAKLTDP